MNLKLNLSQKKSWVLIYSGSVFVLLMFHMLYPVNFYLGQSIYDSYYWFATAMFIAFYFSKRGLQDGIEMNLLTAYCAWLFVSRLLNGDVWLENDKYVVLLSLITCVCMPVMLNLSVKYRMLFIDMVSLAACTFTTVLSSIGVYSAISQRYLLNPITGATLANFGRDGLALLDNNPNVCAAWLFVGLWLLIHQFIKHKKRFVRIPLFFACLVHYVAMALTYCRNIKVACSFGFSLLAILIVLNRFKNKNNIYKVISCILISCLVFVFSYKSYDFATLSVGKASSLVSESQAESLLVQNGGEPEKKGPDYIETWGFADTGRLPIYKSILTDLIHEPLRLFRGTVSSDVMDSANKRLPKEYAHAHCVYLEILARTGIPGFILIVAFCLLTLMRIIKLFFSSAALEIKVFTIPSLGFFWYNLLESSWLIVLDFRSISFMLLIGTVLAFSRDLKAVME